MMIRPPRHSKVQFTRWEDAIGNFDRKHYLWNAIVGTGLIMLIHLPPAQTLAARL